MARSRPCVPLSSRMLPHDSCRNMNIDGLGKSSGPTVTDMRRLIASVTLVVLLTGCTADVGIQPFAPGQAAADAPGSAPTGVGRTERAEPAKPTEGMPTEGQPTEGQAAPV